MTQHRETVIVKGRVPCKICGGSGKFEGRPCQDCCTAPVRVVEIEGKRFSVCDVCGRNTELRQSRKTAQHREPEQPAAEPGEGEPEWSVCNVPMGHHIESDHVTFYRSDRLPGNALAQLHKAVNNWNSTPAREQLAAENAELRAELQTHQQDLEDAAGELMVDIEPPGTTVSKLLRANGIMRRQRDSLSAKLAVAEAANEGLRKHLREVARRHGRSG